MTDAAALNDAHGIADEVEFMIGAQGALVAELSNPQGRGSVAIQGAQVLTWIPAGHEPVLWLSPATRFTPGESLRGGAPLCWPWFGRHPQDPHLPIHGFARTLDWAVAEVAGLPEGTYLRLRLVPGEAERTAWPHVAELTLEVTLGGRLRLELTTRNTGADAVALTQGIHTYFHVGDIGAVRVEGLEACTYIDKTGSDACIRQAGPILIDREVNRIYLDCPGDAVIVDESLDRRIRVTKRGSRSYVVWNPWAAIGERFGDLGEDGYRHMLCVETTNAAGDSVAVAAGETYTLSTEYAVESL